MPSDSSSPPSNDLQLLSRRVGTGARAHRRKLQELRRGKVSYVTVSGGVWGFWHIPALRDRCESALWACPGD